MIRLTWILVVLALAAVSGHYGYLHFAASPSPAVAPAPAGRPKSARPELMWLQRELDLTASELPTVNALHEEHWTRVAKLRVQLDAERRNAQVTRNPAAGVAIEELCKRSTVTFIQHVTTVLTPEQRQKYLGLVGSCLPPPARKEGASVEPSPRR